MATKSLNLGAIRLSAFGGRGRLAAEVSFPSTWFGVRAAQEPEFAIEQATETPRPDESAPLEERVKAIRWYHTIDLDGGVITPGFLDHRPLLPLYRLPESLSGQRVLDVAKFDGFWAFEFERRGAAEVIALDIETAAELDLPFRTRRTATPAQLGRRFGEGFALAHAALGSKVVGLHANVYDLDPEHHGLFDLVHCGDLLLHLRDPALALSRIRSITRGMALISETIHPDCDRIDGASMVEYMGGRGDNVWWRFGARALKRMIEDAEFSNVEEIARFRIGPVGSSDKITHVVYRATP